MKILLFSLLLLASAFTLVDSVFYGFSIGIILAAWGMMFSAYKLTLIEKWS